MFCTVTGKPFSDSLHQMYILHHPGVNANHQTLLELSAIFNNTHGKYVTAYLKQVMHARKRKRDAASEHTP